jgi:hypothetical protein
LNDIISLSSKPEKPEIIPIDQPLVFIKILPNSSPMAGKNPKAFVSLYDL